MNQNAIADALQRATDTRRVVLARGALGGVEACFDACFGGAAAIVIADETTFEVAGRVVQAQLKAAGRRVAAPLIFPARPRLHADYEHALRIGDVLSQHDAIPVAVGAGTINDLTKLGAYLAGRPYMVVATAASMDGYAAFGAAITRDGYKQTMACPAPRAVVADVDVLVAAPADMTASGYGDLLGKITAGADWLVADAVGAEPVDWATWELVQPAVQRAAADAERLRARDAGATVRLFECLIMSGLAMQAARSSRPASGSEHQLSHLWEMQGLTADGAEVSHGFKVAIGTIAIAAFYERLLDDDLARLDVAAAVRAWPGVDEVEAAVRCTHHAAGGALVEQAVVESRAKYVTTEQLRARLAQLRARWPELRARLRAQLLPAAEVRRLLAAAGCPTEASEIGVSPEHLRASYTAARQIRRRYTVLDLAAETGRLEAILGELFAPAETAMVVSGSS